jgi:hypothetical protein
MLGGAFHDRPGGRLKERDVLATFRANTEGRNVDVFVMGWEQYFDQFRDPIRFLHVDGEHSYEQVAGNIDAALPLMVPGAVMCGDDIHHPPVRQAVGDRFGTFNQTATLWWVAL